MADWPTVWIAAISALAGLSGTLLTNRFTDKARKHGDAREDAAHLRSRFEELFDELDRVQEGASIATGQVLQLMQNPGQAQPIEPQRNLGKVRAFVALYFQDCSDILTLYDADIAGYGVQLRTDIEGGMNQITAVGGYTLLCVQRRSALADQLRVRLQAQGPILGKAAEG